MDHFNYRSGELFAENVAVEDIARRFGTPAYVYSRATLERHYRAYDDALAGRPHLVCYAVKANSNIAVLNVLARLGAGFDIVSAGELERVIDHSGEPENLHRGGHRAQPWLAIPGPPGSVTRSRGLIPQAGRATPECRTRNWCRTSGYDPGLLSTAPLQQWHRLSGFPQPENSYRSWRPDLPRRRPVQPTAPGGWSDRE